MYVHIFDLRILFAWTLLSSLGYCSLTVLHSLSVEVLPVGPGAGIKGIARTTPSLATTPSLQTTSSLPTTSSHPLTVPDHLPTHSPSTTRANDPTNAKGTLFVPMNSMLHIRRHTIIIICHMLHR